MEQKMKDSGIRWLPKIPENWDAIRLKYSVKYQSNDFTDGDWIESKDISEDGIRYLTSGNVGPSFYKEQGAGFISETIFSKLKCKEVFPGDLLISRLNEPIGRTCIVPGLGYRIVTCVDNVIYRHDAERFNSHYMVWLLNNPAFSTHSMQLSAGSGMKRISRTKLGLIDIPVPPLSEQEAIAVYLDKKCGEIDELIKVEQQMISDLESYRQAVITEAVTHGLNTDAPQKQSSIRGIENIPANWGEVNLLKVIYLRARLGWRGLKAEEYVDDGYPFLSAFNIVKNQLVWNNLNFINQQRYDESPEIKLSLHDILIVKDGAGIGKCARVKDMPFGESTVNSSLGVITVSDKLYYSYLFYFFLSTPFQDNVYFLKNGMGVPHLTQENLKSVRIPLPPVVEQKAIADYLDAKCAEIDELIKVKQEKIETLKQYRQSLIFEAVTGKINIPV